MSLQINTENISQNNMMSGLYSKLQGYASKLLNTDANDFADYLKENYDSIDSNSDKSLSKDEISQAVSKDNQNTELQKLLEKKDLETLMSDVDTDKDGAVTYSEVNPDSNVPKILKSALREIQTTKDWGMSAQNLTQNLLKNYYAAPELTNFTAKAVSYIL